MKIILDILLVMGLAFYGLFGASSIYLFIKDFKNKVVDKNSIFLIIMSICCLIIDIICIVILFR